MIIDCHCHAGEGDGFTGPWDTRAPLSSYLRRAGEAGIERTVVFAAFHSDYAAANRSVLALIAQQPQRLLGFAFIHCERDRGRIGSIIAQAVREWGFCGIKAHRHDAPLSRELCEAARRFKLPILFDPTGEVHAVGLAAHEFPDVPFIVPHLGSFADDFRAHAALIDLMVRLPNVYGDTAGVRRFDYLREAVARAGAHKVLFGSDGPFLHPGLELEKIRLLRLPNAQERLVLGGNLRRLIHAARRTRFPASHACRLCGHGRPCAHERRYAGPLQ
jgi:uncharacterized protein